MGPELVSGMKKPAQLALKRVLQGSVALAEFVSRPQAGVQIGAMDMMTRIGLDINRDLTQCPNIYLTSCLLRRGS